MRTLLLLLGLYATLFAGPLQLQTEATTVVLPLGDTTYNVVIDWGDGSPLDTVIYPEIATHTQTNRDNIISITGSLSQLGYGDKACSEAHIHTILSFGDIGLSSISGLLRSAGDSVAFFGIPDSLPETITDLSYLLYGFKGDLMYTSVLSSLRNWDVSHVKNMAYIFAYGESIDPSNFLVGLWDYSSVENMTSFYTGGGVTSGVGDVLYEKLLYDIYHSDTIPLGASLGVENTYCPSTADTLRWRLINVYGWHITDLGIEYHDGVSAYIDSIIDIKPTEVVVAAHYDNYSDASTVKYGVVIDIDGDNKQLTTTPLKEEMHYTTTITGLKGHTAYKVAPYTEADYQNYGGPLVAITGGNTSFTTANSAPIGDNDTIHLIEDSVSTLFGTSVIHFSDADSGDTLVAWRIDQTPRYGTLFIDRNSNGIVDTLEIVVDSQQIPKDSIAFLRFKPDSNGFGSPYSSLLYSLYDGYGYGYGAHSDTVLFIVEGTKDSVFMDSTYPQEGYEDSFLVITPSMTNFVDVDRDSVAILLDTGENYSIVGDTVFFDTNYLGKLSVPLRLTAGGDITQTVILPITLLNTNDTPFVTHPLRDLTAKEDFQNPYNIVIDSVFGDIDSNDTTFHYEFSSSDTLLRLERHGASTFRIYSKENVYGEELVFVTAVDDSGAIAVDTFTFTITPVNDRPNLTFITPQSISEGDSLVVTVAMTDASDIEGDSLSIHLSSGLYYYTLGTTVIPINGFTGVLHVPVSVSDGKTTSNKVTLVVTVNSVSALIGSDTYQRTTDKIIVGPNPLRGGELLHVILPKGVQKSRLSIYSAIGTLLDKKEFEESSITEYQWDGRNSSGSLVESGTYLLIIEWQDKSGRWHQDHRSIGVVK